MCLQKRCAIFALASLPYLGGFSEGKRRGLGVKGKGQGCVITEELWQQHDLKSNNNAFSSPLWVCLSSKLCFKDQILKRKRKKLIKAHEGLVVCVYFLNK